MATRTLVVWCPDWPLVAAGVRPDVPAAIVEAGRVTVCSAAARAAGVRRGQRLREAQRRCPDLLLPRRDEPLEARAFEPVVAALAAVCPKVEVVRPGLCAFATRGPSRYFGGDEHLALVTAGAVTDALRADHADAPGTPETPATPDLAPDPGLCRVGVADGVFAARLAAYDGMVVPAGGTPRFLAPRPVSALDRPELARTLARLGVETLGQFAALPAPRVAARFGADGEVAHRLARGLDERPPAARAPVPDLAFTTELDPPAETVEPAAFAGKALADDLHAALAARGLACTRVLVEAETEHGERLSRLWRHDGTLTPAAIAQRVRWQLDGWLAGAADSRPSGGIALLRLVPDETYADRGVQLELWGGVTATDELAARALTRLQGLLGFEAVATAVRTGGRGPADQLALVPWGEPRPAPHDGTPPWPGAMPAPSPALLHPEPIPADVVAADGTPVAVTGRAACDREPARLKVGRGGWERVVGWAGPWPVDERWWAPGEHRRRARFQVLTDGGAARLLAVENGRWHVEATYD